MAATQEAKLKIPVREPAKTVHILPNLEHNLLLSASKFADAGYVSILTPSELLIVEGDKIVHKLRKEAILRGWRDEASGLWRVPLEDPSQPEEHVLLTKEVEEAIGSVYELPSSKQIVRYLHACAGFPAKLTWLHAIKKGSYATWLYRTLEAARKHFPESDETHQGHMRSIKQGVRSIKQKEPESVTLADGTEMKLPLKKHQDIVVRVREAKYTIYTDQTGAFPVQSQSGNKYIMVLCKIDNNIIINKPIKRMGRW